MRNPFSGIVLCVLIAVSLTQAETPLVIASRGARPVAEAVTKPADFFVCSVSITSEGRTPEASLDDLQLANTRLLQTAEQDPVIRIHKGPVCLAAEDQANRPFATISVEQVAQATSHHHILVPIALNKPNALSAGLMINDFLAKIRMPARTKYTQGQVKLAVDNPEQYRGEILEKIAQNISLYRKVLEPRGLIQVSGLETPVRVSQLDDQTVALYIDYRLTLKSDDGR